MKHASANKKVDKKLDEEPEHFVYLILFFHDFKIIKKVEKLIST